MLPRPVHLLSLGCFFLARMTGSAEIDFSRDIEPLFRDHCHSCHGTSKQQAGLRLDQRTAALAGGDAGPLLVPGVPDQSLLIQVIEGTHPDIARMPQRADPLPPDSIRILRAWIDAGAPWPETSPSQPTSHSRAHWAWTPPTRPPVPWPATPSHSIQPSLSRNPIDAFVQQRLADHGWSLSPPADRLTLFRRLHLDLIGLPPSPTDADRFAADPSPDAIRRAIEDLLASPHFGERWGRHWLDAARYADSDGFEKDKPRFIWAYRDWVIQAFNRDLPYDQFILEQVAGDLLPGASHDQIVATGFLRNAMLNEEGGVDPEQFRTDGLIDRMDALGKAVLGVTIQCAQCHDHKFDPISQEEYFRLFAFLNNDHEASAVHYTASERQQIDSLLRKVATLEEGLREQTPDWPERLANGEQNAAGPPSDWQVLRLTHSGDNGPRFYYLDDGSVRASGYAPTVWTARFAATNPVPDAIAFRVEQLTDPNLPAGGPGRSIYGTAALSEFRVTAIDPSQPTNRVTLKFVKATADFANATKRLPPIFQSQSRLKKHGEDPRTFGPVDHAIDGNGDTAWGIDAGPGRRNTDRQAVFVAEAPVPFPPGATLSIDLQQTHGGDNSDDNQNHNLGRFRIAVSSNPDATADPIPVAVRRILQIPPSDRTPAQQTALFRHWRSQQPEFAEVNARIEHLLQSWPEGTTTLTLIARTDSGPGDEIRTTHVFRRGDWLRPGREVSFGTPAVLHGLPDDADATRLTLARWLVDRQSPTTARVAVNRVWQQLFGIGLVETPEDFGLQSPAPSHPLLLDWLATEFMDHGWSTKQLLRLILTSATYQQASRLSPDHLEQDPYNRLLARAPRLRVEGEIVRDLALAAGGLLDPTLGGRSVYPPAPDFLFQPPASYGPKVWSEEPDSHRYRRSLYVFKFRSVPYPVLANFDAPTGDFACVRRPRSNTALQALTTLNEIQFVEAARALAHRTLAEAGPTDDDRLVFAFRQVLTRPPDAEELAEIRGLLNRQRQRLSDGWLIPRELIGNDTPSDLLPGISPTLLAAYTVVGRALLNLDEAITRE